MPLCRSRLMERRQRNGDCDDESPKNLTVVAGSRFEFVFSIRNHDVAPHRFLGGIIVGWCQKTSLVK